MHTYELREPAWIKGVLEYGPKGNQSNPFQSCYRYFKVPIKPQEEIKKAQTVITSFLSTLMSAREAAKGV